MKKLSIFTVTFLLCSSSLFAQVRISNEAGEADPSAMLDVQSSNKGFLPPRMTLAQRDAIINPAEGLTVFCTDCDYNNTSAVTMYSNGMWHILYDFCLRPILSVIHFPTVDFQVFPVVWEEVPSLIKLLILS